MPVASRSVGVEPAAPAGAHLAVPTCMRLVCLQARDRLQVHFIGSASRSSSKLGSKGSPWTRSSHYLPRLRLATGGRNGHTEFERRLSSPPTCLVPKEMGGQGKPGTATPEHLFAAGYAACFGGALDFVGKQHKQDASKAEVTCAVSIGPREGGGFGLAVKHGRRRQDPCRKPELEKLVEEAHAKICPYSHATRGNVEVTFEVIGG